MSKVAKSRRLVALACMMCAPAFADEDTPPLTPLPVGSVEVRDLPAILPDGTTTLSLHYPAIPVASKAHAGKPKKPLVVKSARSDDHSVVLGDGAATFNLTVPGSRNLASNAVLNLSLPAGAVKAEASASVGKEEGQTAFWHKDSAGLEAELSGPMGASLSVSGQNQLSLTYRAPESVGSSDKSAHVVQTQSQTGRASLSVPVSPLAVTVGGDSSSHRTQEGAPGDEDSFVKSAVRTSDHTGYVDVEWQPLADLKLKGGSAVRVASISWQNAHASTYRSANPNITATLTPLRDTTVTAKIEHVVAPYDAAAFANYASAAQTPDASGFEPDHAWQIETRVEQTVGTAKVSATYTTARQGTVTEFAEVGGAQAPATTPLKGRESLAVALQMPLASVGLPHTDLSSEARWQSSRVIDPVTQQTRTASGEPGETVSVKLAHKLPSRNLKLGLTGDFTGARTSYQVSELSTTAPGASLGAFVTYAPGPYELDLNVTGLYGGATRDDFFRGARGSSEFSHSMLQDHSGPSVKLELKRPL